MGLWDKAKEVFLEEVPNTKHLEPKEQKVEDFDIDKFLKELDKPPKDRINTKQQPVVVTSPVISKPVVTSTPDLIGKTREEYKKLIQEKINSVITPGYKTFLNRLDEMSEIDGMPEQAAYKAALKTSGISVQEIEQVHTRILSVLSEEKISFESLCEQSQQTIVYQFAQTEKDLNDKILQNKKTIEQLNQENSDLYSQIGSLTTTRTDESEKVSKSLQTFLDAMTEIKSQTEADAKTTSEHLVSK